MVAILWKMQANCFALPPEILMQRVYTILRHWLRFTLWANRTYTHNCLWTMVRYILQLALIYRDLAFTPNMRMDGTTTQSNHGYIQMHVDSAGSLHTIQDQNAHDDARIQSNPPHQAQDWSREVASNAWLRIQSSGGQNPGSKATECEQFQI